MKKKNKIVYKVCRLNGSYRTCFGTYKTDIEAIYRICELQNIYPRVDFIIVKEVI